MTVRGDINTGDDDDDHDCDFGGDDDNSRCERDGRGGHGEDGGDIHGDDPRSEDTRVMTFRSTNTNNMSKTRDRKIASNIFGTSRRSSDQPNHCNKANNTLPTNQGYTETTS